MRILGSLFSSYYYYTNTTFDVANLSLKEITKNGINYLLYDYDKTAIVWTNNYSGDIVIPSEVTYNNDTYKVGCSVRCSEKQMMKSPVKLLI